MYPYWQVRNTPQKFVADVMEQIAEVALSSRQALIGITQWLLSKLWAYLISQKIIPEIIRSWLRTLLLRFGIRWRPTKTCRESQDPEFQAKYRCLRWLHQRRPGGGRRICVDECGPLNHSDYRSHEEQQGIVWELMDRCSRTPQPRRKDNLGNF